MKRSIPVLAAAVVLSLGCAASAADSGNQNGASPNPQSSTAPAAAPATKAPSPGTVGGMKDAGGGSFTASEKDKNGAKLDSNK